MEKKKEERSKNKLGTITLLNEGRLTDMALSVDCVIAVKHNQLILF